MMCSICKEPPEIKMIGSIMQNLHEMKLMKIKEHLQQNFLNYLYSTTDFALRIINTSVPFIYKFPILMHFKSAAGQKYVCS